MRCEMGVDLRYFWTGAVMRAGAYIDSPLKLSVNIDPDHSKMFIKWQEEVGILYTIEFIQDAIGLYLLFIS